MRFEELAAKLVAHDAIEREIFYPACEEKRGLTHLLGEALVEHGVVEFMLFRADHNLGKDTFDHHVKVLKERGLSSAEGGLTSAGALTAYARASHRTRAFRVGFDMHVAKPIDPAELAVVLANLVTRHRRD